MKHLWHLYEAQEFIKYDLWTDFVMANAYVGSGPGKLKSLKSWSSSVLNITLTWQELPALVYCLFEPLIGPRF